MQCLFQRFVVKPIAKKHVLDLSERQYMMAQRFELVLAHAYEASSLGRTIHHKSREERVDLVLQALGGKALNTLKARIRVASRMISWGVDQNMSVFPIDEQVVLEYTDFLVKDGARFSALTGVIETCQFLHHVLGVDMASRALSHPLLNGRIRKARLERPARKQARPFLASEVAALEHFVRDTSKPCQDRFAAGAMLFAIYSRSRIGDLKSIKDPVADITADKTGYLEVTSLSHKTRSMGNALGFELPLIAPVQGITDRPWGPAWLQACEESAHRFQDMLPGQPMIQSPLMAGGWSGREMSNAKFAHWVGAILSETGLQNMENFSGHSAKRTAAPIREMEGVLLQAEAGDDLEANWTRSVFHLSLLGWELLRMTVMLKIKIFVKGVVTPPLLNRNMLERQTELCLKAQAELAGLSALAGSWEMANLLKSSAAFREKALECGLLDAQLAVLEGKGIDTLATLAYVLTTPGVTPSELALRELLDSTSPDAVSLQALASIRRLTFEAQTLCIAQIKASIETEGEPKVELAPAERAQRIAAQKRRLAGFDLTGPLENAYSNYVYVSAMVEHAWIRLAEEVPSLKRDPAGQLPLDLAFPRLQIDPHVTYFLQPLQGKSFLKNAGADEDPPPAPWRGRGQAKGSGKAPSELQADLRANVDQAGEKFLCGSFRHGGIHGVFSATREFPLSVAALIAFVRISMPEFQFSSIALHRDISTCCHKDTNNFTDHNLVCPLSEFGGGEIWVNEPGGLATRLVNGTQLPGRLFSVSDGPVIFPARACLHSTEPWTGSRVVLIAYAGGDHNAMSAADQTFLEQLGFPLPQDSGTDCPPVTWQPDVPVDLQPFLNKVQARIAGRSLSDLVFLEFFCGSGGFCTEMRRKGLSGSRGIDHQAGAGVKCPVISIDLATDGGQSLAHEMLARPPMVCQIFEA
ncbi:pol [Symbiodinium sp. KB8]|nr:pol [Symbiodinium sp. KB8]